MNVRPIIFSPPMVRAILAGRKTVTRRVVKSTTALEFLKRPGHFRPSFVAIPENGMCPYGARGDVLYVRERFSRPVAGHVLYAADWSDSQLARSEAMRRRYPALAKTFHDAEWRPSIHMPRNLARLFLEIVHVDCERLQDITEREARREGFERAEGRDGLRYGGGGCWVSYSHPSFDLGLEPSARAEFASAWDQLNMSRDADYSFKANPWVWVIRFVPCNEPIDPDN